MTILTKTALIATLLGTGYVASPLTTPTTPELAPAALQASETASMPALLQASPDPKLNCTVESKRQFNPTRHAFVMTKVQVCR